MIKWAPYPFLRIVFFFAAGILLYLQAGNLSWAAGVAFALFLALYFFLLFFSRKNKSVYLTNLAGMAGMLLFFLAGYLVTHLRTVRHQDTGLRYQPEFISHYLGVADDYITHKPTTVSTTIQIKAVKRAGIWQPAKGQVRLTVKQERGALPFSYGTVLLVKGPPQPVNPPLNPGQFDYQRYLANRQVYYQHYLRAAQFTPVGYEPGFAFMALSIKVRDKLDARLRDALPSEREYAVAAALLLGIKDHLPDDVKLAFSQSGTMHVLAVSGLHVGVIFYILNLLLGKWSKRRGLKWFRFLVLLAIFSMYAFITALSPSVLRAVAMFIIFVAADTFRRQTNIYNTLAATAFFLLLYNPYFLVEVGFQLSFLAVLGIVYFSPKLEALWLPETYFTRFIWKMTCASVAAQLTTLPLTLYYFHQFPVYFLAANLVAITLSSLALMVGLILLAFSWLPLVPGYLGLVLSGLLRLMHESNSWLLRAPFPVVPGINLTTLQTWLLYLLLGLLVIFFARKQLVYFAFFCGAMLFFSGLKITAARARQAGQWWVVYQAPKATVLGFISGNRGILLADSAFYANPRNHQYLVQPHWQQAGLTHTRSDTLRPGYLPASVPAIHLPGGNQLLQWQGVKILLCRQALQAATLHTVKPDFLLVSQQPYLAIDKLAPALKGVRVILDGSNGSWYQRLIEQKLTKAGINCYNVNNHGALVQPVPLKN